jgi:hypothetical protein
MFTGITSFYVREFFFQNFQSANGTLSLVWAISQHEDIPEKGYGRLRRLAKVIIANLRDHHFRIKRHFFGVAASDSME